MVFMHAGQRRLGGRGGRQALRGAPESGVGWTCLKSLLKLLKELIYGVFLAALRRARSLLHLLLLLPLQPLAQFALLRLLAGTLISLK